MAKVNRVLEQENAKLREDVVSLKELLKLQRQVTGGTKFTESSVEATAGVLMKAESARGNKAELAGLLNRFCAYIVHVGKRCAASKSSASKEIPGIFSENEKYLLTT